jgi:hypothetical protein
MIKKELLFSLVIVLCTASFLTAAEIPLMTNGGVYELPAKINGVITRNFILDSGAAEVSIPVDVVYTLVNAGTINNSDFLEGETYLLADGSALKSPRFIIRELEVGNHKFYNIPAFIGSAHSSLLLGQSFLSHISSWTIDNDKCTFILSELHVVDNYYVYKQPSEVKLGEQSTLQMESSQSSPISFGDIDTIRANVKKYYALLQKHDIDCAMNCYSSEKRSAIKRKRLEVDTTNTEFYIIDHVNVISVEQDEATAFTRVTQKQYNQHPEVWEITFKFIRDGNQWKIQGTQATKVFS